MKYQYKLILKNLKYPTETLTLSQSTTPEHAEQMRKDWRKVLGDKHWTINRRPGLDTLDHLAMTIIKSEENGG